MTLVHPWITAQREAFGNRGLKSEETLPVGSQVDESIVADLVAASCHLQNPFLSFQIFPSKWELSCGHAAVVKAFVSISIL